MADDIPTIRITRPAPTPILGNAAGTTPIIGNAAVAQPTTPVGGLAPPQTPITPTSQTLPELSIGEVSPPPVTAAQSVQSFQSSLTNLIKQNQNPLNLYWQPAYHFKLFMAGDDFTMEHITSLSDLVSQINSSLNQVIIAESGVTGYNIKDVEFETVNAQNGFTRDQKATIVTMTITEPMGISFLDALFAGASLLNIFDYTKMNYFLMLSFTGYNSELTGSGTTDGSYAGNPIKFPNPPFKNGGQWLYVLTFNTIDVKLNEGGGIYKLSFTSNEAMSVMNEDQQFGTGTDGLTVSGKTLGEMFTDFTTQLNQKWKDRFKSNGSGNALMQFQIVTHPIPFPGSAANKDPKDFSTFNSKPLDSSSRAVHMSNTTSGVTTAQIAPGTSINEFITSTIKSTEQGQKLIVDDPVPQNPDESSGQATATGLRESTLFSIEPVISHISRDPVTGNYVKTIAIHIVGTYSQTATLTPAQRDDAAKSPATQQKMIQALMNNGFLRKEYDYIFTGLNTEVIDFRIDFNLANRSMLPKLGGVRISSLTEAVQKQYNPATAVAPMANVPPTDVSTAQITPFTRAPNAPGGKLYIEDLLTNYTQGNPLPVSFTDHYQDILRELPNGLDAQYHPGESMAATVFAQVFGNTMTGAFQSIELNIRGDPFWLGVSNAERQIALRQGNVPTNDPSNLPDGSSGNSCFILKFKYPLQLGDNFKPILKDSVVFNGIYEVWKTKHNFADGMFKQTLYANRMSLINLNLALSAQPYTPNTGQSSSPIANAGQSNGQGTASSGSTPGTGSGTIAPTGSLPNSAQLQGLAQESYNFWTSHGYSPAGASAMVAQEEAESQFGTAPNTNVPGVQAGNFQWNPTREAQILAGTGIDVTTADHMGQLQAALWEQTQGRWTSVGSQLMMATDPGAAGVLATTKYEIPANTAVQAQKRGGRAAFWATQYAGTPLPNAS